MNHDTDEEAMTQVTDHRTEAARLLAPAAPDPIDVVARQALAGAISAAHDDAVARWDTDGCRRQGATMTMIAGADVMRHLGPVTLPAQDRAEELIAAYVDEYAARYEAAGNPPHMDRWAEVSADRRRLSVETMTAALAKLGAPPPAVAPGPVPAGVSVDALVNVYMAAYATSKAGDAVANRAGIEAVVARLGAAPVTAEELAEASCDEAYGTRAWCELSDAQQTARINRARGALAIIAARKAGGQ